MTKNKNKNLIVRDYCSCVLPSQRRNFRSARRNVSKKRIAKTYSGSVSLSIIAVLFAVLIGVAYLYSINSSAVKGYQIKKIENEINDLKKENDKLKIKEAELNSLYRIEENTESLNMAKPDDIVYIEENSPVALK